MFVDKQPSSCPDSPRKEKRAYSPPVLGDDHNVRESAAGRGECGRSLSCSDRGGRKPNSHEASRRREDDASQADWVYCGKTGLDNIVKSMGFITLTGTHREHV